MAEPLQQTLLLSSPPDDVDSVHDLLGDVWAGRADIGLRDRISFETAVIELASNVLRHADSGSGISCRLDIAVRDGRLEATLTDSGEPGAIELAERTLPDEFAESGRGIPLVQALVDVLEYEPCTGLNRWHIARNLGS